MDAACFSTTCVLAAEYAVMSWKSTVLSTDMMTSILAFYHEDGGNSSLRNIGGYLPNYTESRPIIPQYYNCGNFKFNTLLP
jgi:hypothetical protein